ncbi:hypothetical protein [Kitasatospora sp. NPDC098663]|uniref:hypothetical protein n=1 Tax=Kitasatospora sp. NPDC098663 TaxID=3364096 RepID=UPI003821353A
MTASALPARAQFTSGGADQLSPTGSRTAPDALGVQPSWVPMAGTASWRVDVGRYFEAVRCGAEAGALIADRLGRTCGPVIASPAANFYDFLLPRGTRVDSDIPKAWQLPTGTPIRVPPLSAASGRFLHWVVPPGGTTTAESLYAAAVAAFGRPERPTWQEPVRRRRRSHHHG